MKCSTHVQGGVEIRHMSHTDRTNFRSSRATWSLLKKKKKRQDELRQKQNRNNLKKNKQLRKDFLKNINDFVWKVVHPSDW